MAYATIAELSDYVDDDSLVADPVLAARELERASRDIDNYVGGSQPYLASGWRFNPEDPLTVMSVGEIGGLMRATCAQAEWRLFKGAVYFIESESGEVQGPDFTISGTAHQWMSRKALLELRLWGFSVTGARAVP